MSKPAWLIGKVLKQCGVPCAEEIAMMLGRKAVVKETRYNLLDFSGEYDSYNSYASYVESTTVTFAVGGFPLTSERIIDVPYPGNSTVVGSSTALYVAEITSGNKVEIDVTFPLFSVEDTVEYDYITHRVLVDNDGSIFGGSYADIDIWYSRNNDNAFTISENSLMNDPVIVPKLGDDGQVIGLTLTGELKASLKQIRIIPYAAPLKNTEAFVTTATVTFGSYDDITITVKE